MPSFINSNWTAIGRNVLGNIVYRDTSGQCWALNWSGTSYEAVSCGSAITPVNAQTTPSGNVATGSPSNPTGSGQQQVLIQSGQSWLEDLLNTLLGVTAIGGGATHIPSLQHVAQPTNVDSLVAQINAQNLAAQQQAQNAGAQTGAQLGGSIQDFITKNATLLLIVGLGVVLFRSGRR